MRDNFDRLGEIQCVKTFQLGAILIIEALMTIKKNEDIHRDRCVLLLEDIGNADLDLS